MERQDDESVEEGRIMKSGSGRGVIIEFFSRGFYIMRDLKVSGVIFNDRDDEFPAACSVLFQKQAEDYFDPESLIMVGTAFRQRLQKLSI